MDPSAKVTSIAGVTDRDGDSAAAIPGPPSASSSMATPGGATRAEHVDLVAQLYGLPPEAADRLAALDTPDAAALADRLDAWIEELARRIADARGLIEARVRVVRNLPRAWKACPTVTPGDEPPELFFVLLDKRTQAMAPPEDPRPMKPASFGSIFVTKLVARIRRAIRPHHREPWA